jgi:hypothetical protein
MDEYLAMFQDNLPVNPLPFLLKIAEEVKQNGTDHIRSDRVKAMLWVILAQAYGQLAIIDLCAEWDRLKEVFKPYEITCKGASQNKAPHV